MNKIFHLFLALTFSFLFCLNLPFSPVQGISQHKPLIVTTIPSLKAITKEIVDDHFQVIALVSAETDPHQYSPKPSDIEIVRKADVFISVGKEEFLGQLPKEGKPGQVRLSWKDWIKSGVYIKNENPHYIWLYPKNAEKIAEKIKDTLSEKYPNLTKEMEINFEKFVSKLNQLKIQIKELIEKANVGKEQVVLAAPHFEPLMEFMGIKVLDIVMKGEGKTPSVNDIASIEKEMLKKNVKSIIALYTMKEGIEGKISQKIAKDVNATVIYLYGLPINQNDSYTDFILYDASILIGNLQQGHCVKTSQGPPEYTTTLLITIVFLVVSLLIETFVLLKFRT